MRSSSGAGIIAAALCAAAAATVLADGPPPWAYGFTTPPPAAGTAAPPAAPAQPPADDGSKKTLSGSSLQFTTTEIRDPFGPADWFPGDHPAMPAVVAHGRKPDVRACSLCHYPNGKGRPENSGVSGLPVSYFTQTMADFANGARKSADARKANTSVMSAIAKAMTAEEVKAAAEYFAAMPWTSWIKVVETASVPRTRVAGGLFLAMEGGEKEPIGQRIIEVPEQTESTELLRNPRSGFVAYAPIGSIRKGEALVTLGSGKTTACGVCHGANLEGLGPVPGLAGRSPSYLVRQMFDMQQGRRTGPWTDLMKAAVAKLSTDEMLAIAAYVASRPAPAPAPRKSAP